MVLSKTLSQVVYYKSNSQFYEVDPIKLLGWMEETLEEQKGVGAGEEV